MNQKSNLFHSSVSGGFWLVLGKAWFVVSAYVLYSSLARLLSPTQFGIYGVVVNFVSIFNIVLITSTIQSVSKFTAVGEVQKVKRQALKIVAIFAASISVVCFFSANLAASMMRDSSLAFPIKLASLIIFFYGIYAVFIGSLNGTKQFKKQGLFDAGYATIRIALILIFASFIPVAIGAIYGFIAAAAVIVVVAFLLLGLGDAGGAFQTKDFLKFSLLLAVFHLTANFMMSFDLFLLKSFAPNHSDLPGYYTANLTVARIPYTILVALNFIVFPLVAGSKASQNNKINLYIEKTLKASFILLLIPTVLMAGNPSGFLSLIYPKAYATGADALRILSFAYLFFSLFMLFATIMNSLGKPGLSVIVAVIAILSETLVGSYLIPKQGLSGAALCAILSFATAALVSFIYLKIKFKNIFSGSWLFQTLLSGATIFILAKLFQTKGIVFIFHNAALVAVYFCLLYVFKVITVNELIASIPKKTNANV